MRSVLDTIEHTTDPSVMWNCFTEIEGLTKSAKRALVLRLLVIK
jgi:hypothetical protein